MPATRLLKRTLPRLTYDDMLKVQRIVLGYCQHHQLFLRRSHVREDLCKNLIYLMWIKSQRSHRRAWYAVPGRKWLGCRSDVSPRSITTHIGVLIKAGIFIRIYRRADKHGHPTTPLYKPGRIILSAIHTAHKERLISESNGHPNS